MTEPGDLEPRVAALENDVSDLKRRLQLSEQDAAAARVLAGGADRDVAEIRSEIREFREQNTRLHNTTREDIADMRTTLEEHTSAFVEIRGKFDMLGAGQERIAELLDQVIEQRG